VEEREDGRAHEATDSDAVAARTRALVEESRQLLRRLERLLGRDDAHADVGTGDHATDVADGDGTADDAADHES
jgi:hypothetical protein